MRQLVSTTAAGRRAGLPTGKLEQWLHAGYIEIEDPGRGRGSQRYWSPREVDDIVAIGGVVCQAIDAGLLVRPVAIRDMWVARSLGLGWRVTLDTGKAGT